MTTAPAGGPHTSTATPPALQKPTPVTALGSFADRASSSTSAADKDETPVSCAVAGPCDPCETTHRRGTTLTARRFSPLVNAFNGSGRAARFAFQKIVSIFMNRSVTPDH